MIADLMPAGVHCVETWAELPDEQLYPEEEQAIARAVAKRRIEFATVRGCVRAALAEMALERGPMVPGERGAPQWPDEVVGSLTHCLGYRAAAVARSSQILAIGIDAEPNEPLPDGVLAAVAGPAEISEVVKLQESNHEVHWDRLLFSAKESVYKAWFPLARTFLEFDDAVITFGPNAAGSRLSGSFSAQLQVPGPWPTGRTLSGRWLAQGGFIGTAIVLAR